MSGDGVIDYDVYWRERNQDRTRARSEARARLACELLRARGLNPASSSRLLEVGCGPGWALEVFAREGYEASGVDMSDVALTEARSRGLNVESLNLEQKDQATSGARVVHDVIVALEVLEHLVDPLSVLISLADSLAEGGHLVVSLPNEFHLLRRLQIFCGRSIGGHDDPHLHYFDDRSSRRLFEAASMTLLDRRSDSVVPPRRMWLRKLGIPLARVAPSLLAISNIYLLSPMKKTTREVTFR